MAEIFDPNATAPDFSAQTANVARQRKLADYLRAQADREQAPQGQMVGGQYIAPNWADMLNKPIQQITAGYMGRQADAAEQGALDQQAAHAAQWRANMPQEVEGRAAIPENYVMQSPEDQAGVPGIEAQPMTLDRVLKHTLAAGGNPALTRDADLFSKYSVANIESKQRQEAARELKEATIASQEKIAREKREDEEKYRRTEAVRAAEAARRDGLLLAKIAASGGGGGGGGGMGGQAMVIGADEAQNPIYRHTKSGALFQYNEIGAPVPYKGAVGAKPVPSKEPTEDQGKAAGWFKQASKAFDDMEAATKEDPNASKPTIGERVASSLPWGSAEAVIATQGPARQRFTQAASAMSEAVLRAATGAGVNRDEALQKVRELTPIYGEDPSLTKQKRASMLMYLDALQTRAGRALPKATAPAPAPAPGAGGASGGWWDAGKEQRYQDWKARNGK